MGETKLTSKEYLHIIPYRDLTNWSVGCLLGEKLGFTNRYPLVSIAAFLTRNKTRVEIQDDVLYTRVTIKTAGMGVCVRDQLYGVKIGTKKQFAIHSAQFLVSKIDARNGAIGIVPEEAEGAVITGNFWAYDIDTTKVNPTYLTLITSTKQFTSFAGKASSGTTNRLYLQEDQFLDVKIPLPSLEEQNAIVETYENTFSIAKRYEQEAERINNSIETYLLEELGLDAASTTPQCARSDYKYLIFANMKDILDRWDVYNVSNGIFNVLRSAKYPIVSLGGIYDFITRTWRKSGNTFQYIELGDVDPLYGITNAQILEVKKAPSRATQTVQAEDLIIGTTRPYLKRFAIVTDKYDNSVCSSGFQVIAPAAGCNLRFLHEYLMTEVATRQFEHYMTGALYPAITNKDLRKIQIPLPPLEVQNEIVAHISERKEQIKSLLAHAAATRTAAIEQFEQTIFE